MSDQSNQEQQQSNGILDGSHNDPMYRNKNNMPDQSYIQHLSASLNETITVSSTTNENEEDKNAGQQLRQMNVVIRLNDCMKCFVKIPCCQLEEQDICSDMITQTTLEQQIQEQRGEEEEEKVSQEQSEQQYDNRDPSQEETIEEFSRIRLDFEDSNFTEIFNYLDLS